MKASEQLYQDGATRSVAAVFTLARTMVGPL